jgi:plasmid maintenance system antidote protein VapI
VAKENEITQEEILEIIEQMVSKWGSQRAVADHLEISNAYMSDILAGKRLVSDAVAKRLGYTKIVKYRKDGSLDKKGE